MLYKPFFNMNFIFFLNEIFMAMIQIACHYACTYHKHYYLIMSCSITLLLHKSYFLVCAKRSRNLTCFAVPYIPVYYAICFALFVINRYQKLVLYMEVGFNFFSEV